MISLSAERLLDLWDQGARRHPLDRALLLFAVAEPQRPVDSLADLPLGACQSALMRLHWASFGRQLPVWLDCPHCGERMEFELDSAQLPPMVPPPTMVEAAGRRWRCPASRDLAVISDNLDLEQASRQLLCRCADADAALPTDEHDVLTLLQHLETALEAADPWADLSLAYQCPACERHGESAFDIASYLWEEIDSQARHLLDEVHVLAQAYGWSETQILALSDARRMAYQARVNP
jgi:rubredoxin